MYVVNWNKRQPENGSLDSLYYYYLKIQFRSIQLQNTSFYLKKKYRQRNKKLLNSISIFRAIPNVKSCTNKIPQSATKAHPQEVTTLSAGRKSASSAPGSFLISMNFASDTMADHLAANPFFNRKIFHRDAFSWLYS